MHQAIQRPKQLTQRTYDTTGLFGYPESAHLNKTWAENESPAIPSGEQCYRLTNNINQKGCNPTVQNRKENGTKLRIM